MALAVLATVLGLLTQELSDRLHVQCLPAPRPIVLDGDLGEWEGLPSYPVTSDRPPAKKDVSGDFSFCYTESALFFAGRVVDDDVVRDGAIPWEAPGSQQVSDVIEVFFDLDLVGDLAVQEFDADDVQLFLMPLNRGRRFETYQWKGQRGLFQEYLTGARIATREHPDEGCYEFEAVLPLAPLGLHPDRDHVVGFNVAINDSDAADADAARAGPQAPEDYYLSLNGKQGLFRDPTQLCVLEFQGAPGAAVPGGAYDLALGTLGTIAVLAALVLTGVLALRFHRSFLRRRPRWRWALVAVLVALLVALWAAPLAILSLTRWSAARDVRERAALLREELAPLERQPAVQERLRGADETVLGELFEGHRFRPRGAYSFQLLDLLGAASVGPMEFVSSGSIPGVPFLEYDLFIGEGEAEAPLVLKLAAPVAASRVHLAVAATFLDDVAQVEDALEVHLRFTNGAAATHRFTLDAASGPPVGHVGSNRTWGVADERGNRPFSSLLRSELGGKPLRHIDHRVYDVPDHFHEANQEALLTEISLRKTRSSMGAVLWLSGITVERGVVAPEYVPLRLGSVDPDGFPFEIRDGKQAPRELSLRRGESRELVFGDVPLVMDRLRLYYRHEGSARGEVAEGEVGAQVEVFLAGEPAPQVIPLRMGIEITAEFLSSERLPPTATGFLASWYDTFRGRVPYTGYEIPLAERVARPGPFRVEKLVFSVPVTSSGVFHVGAATAAQRVEPQALPGGLPLAEEGGEVFLRSDLASLAQDESRGLSFAIARGGVVRAVGTSAAARLGARIRGTALPLAEAAGPGDVRRLTWAGREFVSAAVRLPFGVEGSTLLLLRDLSGGASLSRARNLVATVLAIALLPFGLLALVDLLTQVTRIRSRLSFLFLSISVVPLMVMFLFLAKLVGDEQVRVEAQRAEQLLATAHRRLEDLAREASAFAFAVLRQLEKENLLAAPPGERGVKDVLAERVAEFGDRKVPVKLRATFVSGDEAKVTQVYYSDALGRQDRLWEAADVGLSLCWGSLVFSGVAQRGPVTVQVAGIVNEDALEGVGLDGSQRESLSLLAPRMSVNSEDVEGGAVLVATDPEHAFPRAEVEEVARALSRGQSAIRRSSAGAGTRIYDLLRTPAGDPAVILSAGVQARPLTVDLGYARVPLLWFAALLGAVTLGAAWVLASFVTEGITRPLVRLQAGTRALAAGEEAVQVDPEGDDEVAELSVAFNRMSTELRKRIRDQEILSAVTGQLARNLDLSKRVSVALDFLHEILGSCHIACYLYEVSSDTFQLQGSRNEGLEGEQPPVRIAAPQGIFREALRDAAIRHVPSGATVESRRSGTAEERAALPAAFSCWLLPLGRSGHASGVLVLWARTGSDPLEGTDRTFLRNLLAQIATFFDNARLYHLAVEDPATGLAVHSFFLNRLSEEIDRVSESRGELAVVALRWQRRPGADGRPQDARKIMTGLAQEIRRVCHDRELVARVQDLEFEVLVLDGGRGRGDEVGHRVQERIRENRELAVLLREGGLLCQHAVAVYPEDGLSRDFLLASLSQRLEGQESRPAPPSSAELRTLQDRYPHLSLASERLAPLLQQISRVAGSDATVLILGETGTGKEVAAHLLHELSPRRDQPFVAVHCAALPEKLLESELFGHERGAFTGADRRHQGRFEQAQGGTLFLDEVAEIPLEVQVKLLRVLQERRVQRLGGTAELAVDVRLVAATHRSLEDMVAQGTFREDLYYRLKVVTLEVPPLRDRLEDIPSLTRFFLEESNAARDGAPLRGIEPAALDLLRAHRWPGNIRELRNVIQRATVLGRGDRIRAEDIDLGMVPAAAAPSDHSGRSFLPNDRQRQLLALLAERGVLTTKEYFEEAKISRRTALRDLRELLDCGMVLREGTRKAAVYRLSGRA